MKVNTMKDNMCKTHIWNADRSICCLLSSELLWIIIIYGFITNSQKWPGARFSKVPKTFRTRKAIRKTSPRLFCEAGLFICCKGNKSLNNCKKYHASRCLCFEDTKRIMSLEMRPKSFGTFEKRALGPAFVPVIHLPLVDIIRKHYMNFHFYADDSLIYSSFDSAHAIFVFVGSFSSPDLFIRDISVNIHIWQQV